VRADGVVTNQKRGMWQNLRVNPGVMGLSLGLYKIVFHLFLFVQESIIPLSTPPISIAHTTAILLLLRDRCAIYDPPPPDPPFICHTPYNIGNDNIV